MGVAADRWLVGAVVTCVAVAGLVGGTTAAAAYAIRPVSTVAPVVPTSSVADLTGAGAINRSAFVARVPATWKVTQSSTRVSASTADSAASVSIESSPGELAATCAKEMSYSKPPANAADEPSLTFDGSASIGKTWQTTASISFWCFSRSSQVWVVTAYYGPATSATVHDAVRQLASTWRWR